MKFIGGGQVGQVLGVGGQYHPQGDKQQCCVFSRAQKLPQSTWYAETVISSSLTPQAALLVPISGPIDPVDGRDYPVRKNADGQTVLYSRFSSSNN